MIQPCATGYFIASKKRATAIPATPANSFNHFLETVMIEPLTLESAYLVNIEWFADVHKLACGIIACGKPNSVCGKSVLFMRVFRIRVPAVRGGGRAGA